MEVRPILSALLRQKTGPLLVAIQVAISLAILANALFIVKERLAMSQRPSGVQSEADVGYVTLHPLRPLGHNETLDLQHREAEAVAALPGAVSATVMSQMPLSRSGSSGSVRVDPTQTTESASPSFYIGEPGLVHTLGLRIVEGRDLVADDVIERDPQRESFDAQVPRNVLVTRALARVLFPDASSVVGRSFYFGYGPKLQSHIVGVIDTLQSPQAQRGDAGERSIVLPARVSSQFWRIAVRAQPGQLDAVLLRAQELLRQQAPVPMSMKAHTVAEDRQNRYRNERALAWMLVAVSALLLLVTLSGIVGMTSLRVAQRRKQIGVRRALGARWSDIVRYFVVENLMITSAGVAAGLVLAVALNQLLMRQFELPRLPLTDLAIGAALLWSLGIAAVCGPASRAARISPAIATRTA